MLTENKKGFISKKLLIFTLISTVLGSYLYFSVKSDTEFKDFDKNRDIEFVRQAFNQDMYWLVENPEFSLDFLIEHMSPNRDPEYFGKLNFKVLFEKDKPAGFTTYYKQRFYQGKIQFIYVNPAFRNKGYAKKLTKYAAQELFKMGVSIVVMSARVANTPALKAYTAVGFKEYSRDDQFVELEVTKDQLK